MNKKLALILSSALLAFGATACDMTEEVASSQQNQEAAASFRVKTAKNGELHFNLVASNGEVVLSSETYTSRAGALGGMFSILANADEADNYEIKKTKDDQFHFVLKAANGEVIGSSETYTRRSSAKEGTEAVARAAESVRQVAVQGSAFGFETFKGENGEWFFHLQAKNNEIVLQSEGYTRRANAWKGAVAVADAFDDSTPEIRESNDGQFFFTVVAENGEPVAHSETYTRRSSARRGIQDIRDLLDDIVESLVVEE